MYSCSRRPRDRSCSRSRTLTPASTHTAYATATAARFSVAAAYPSSSSVCVSLSSSAWCSCCPCSATRLRPRSRSASAGALRPSMRAALRLPSSRCRINVTPSDSNAPSTVALSAPCRTWSAPPRAPRVRLSASTISDLPLPVSPVRRLRPGPKRTRHSATRARSRTLSPLSPTASAYLFLGDQRAAPAELFPEPAVELFGRAEANHLEPPRMRAAPDRVPRRHRTAPAPVDAHLGRAAKHRQPDVLSWRKHDRTHGQRERVHRHEHEVAKGRLEDRTAAPQRIRSGAGRGCHHHPVDFVHPDRLPADTDTHPQTPSAPSMVTAHLPPPVTPIHVPPPPSPSP